MQSGLTVMDFETAMNTDDEAPFAPPLDMGSEAPGEGSGGERSRLSGVTAPLMDSCPEVARSSEYTPAASATFEGLSADVSAQMGQPRPSIQR